MWFEIPKEQADTPEAKRLLELDAEFARVCAQQHKAISTKQYESDPAAFEAIAKRVRELHQALADAEAAYDRATGEPRPVDLTPDLMREIDRRFAGDDREDVIAKLSKTLGYLRRQGVNDDRIARYVLILANGKKERVNYYADEAQSDFRNVIFWVENARESRLNTPAQIEDLQETLEWLGMQRDPELEQEKRRIMEGQENRTKSKPWWRFW